MKKYLVIHDYGMGRTPFYIYADSVIQITQKYPEFNVLTDNLDTLPIELKNNLKNLKLQEFNINENPTGFLKDVVESRGN